MTTRTRRFLIGSSLVLMLGLCTGLVAYYNGSLPGLSANEPSEISYLPADVTGVAFADVRTIMASEFRQKLRQVIPVSDEKDKIQEELGVDIEKDIDTVLAGFVGDDLGKGGAVVIIRGRLNEGRIEAMAAQHGARVDTYRNKKLLLHSNFPGAHDAAAMAGAGVAPSQMSGGGVAFLEPGLLAIGDAATLKKAIDASADNKNAMSNDTLMAHIRTASVDGNAWVVGRFDAVAKNPAVPDEVKQHLPGINWFSVTAKVNGGLAGAVRAEALDDKAAEDLRQVVSGGLAAIRLMAGRDAKSEAILNSVQSIGSGRTVGLTFTITPELIDMAIGAASGLGPDKLKLK
jgi:hypothetical protein